MNDFELLRGLRACAKPAEPMSDLWPAIAARIGPAQARAVRRSMWPEALAASVLLGIGALAMLVGSLRESTLAADADAGTPWRIREARALDASYDGALAETRRSIPVQLGQALAANRDLDHAQRSLEAAIARDPDAQHLLDLLRRTHDRRLRLAQRQIRLG